MVWSIMVHVDLHPPEGDYDQAICFRCTEWITPAQQWIHRSRTAWPDYTLPTSAVEYGVLFVPIGCKSSPYEDLQWRVSFSVTEKLLIHSFSHTQLLCYALLKIILKDIVKPKHKDLLCSYFIKTIMFWLSEEISPSEWKPENMIRCFLDCIIRLVYCVEYKTCPHYFIPEINLFEDRFTDNEHTALLDTLRLIYGSPWISVFLTTTFMNYILQSVTSHWMPLSASALSCFTYIRVGSNPCSIYRVFTRFENDLHSMLKKNICAIIQGVCARKSVQSSDLNNLSDKNKSLYKKYTKIFDLFKLSLQSDSVSSWLLLASLFYKYKRFHECLDIINYCLFSCTPEKAYLHYTNSLAEQTEFKQMTHTLGLLLAFKYWIIENTCFHYPFCLLPIELKSLISEKHRELYIPPVVYSYLLQFLCCHHLGDNKEKNKALHNLELTISEKFLIFHSEEMLRISHKSLQIVRTLIL